ncbi:hypothetical protein QZH41_005584 [Actinostola sp. cb2023]|nr:hypothetical protein QZH41_005584 [Actinostola sp. cb2023]
MAENNDTKTKIHSLFSKYDRDSIDRLDRAGLIAFIHNDLKDDIDVDENQIETILMLLDQDGCGSVSFEQFYKWYCSDDKLANVKDERRCRIIQKAVRTFKDFDRNKNGTIDRGELEHLLKSLSFDAQSRENAFDTLDKDKNGKISFPEFISWLKWLPSIE